MLFMWTTMKVAEDGRKGRWRGIREMKGFAWDDLGLRGCYGWDGVIEGKWGGCDESICDGIYGFMIF